MKQEKLIKPAQFAEEQIIKAIVDEKWKAGDRLPPERELAQILGITRPTLREALQRLARDGWVNITHGKPSIVNDYKNSGGLAVLKSLLYVYKTMPESFICDWLEFRILVFPDLAKKAIKKNKEKILAELNKHPQLATNTQEFALFDWNLQISIIKASNNNIAKMLYNDLNDIYLTESVKYFESETSKKASILYYKELNNAIINNKKIKKTIKTAMQESLKLWKQIKLK